MQTFEQNNFNILLKENFSELLQSYNNPELGRAINAVDAFFLFRILLNRNPRYNDELPTILHQASTQTYREFLSNLLKSEEFSGQPPLLPANKTWMAELEQFRFWFNTSDREMGVRMALNAFEQDSVDAVKKILKKGMRCIDAGANTGYYSLLFASLVGEYGKVYSFEPMPQNYALLKKNITENKFDGIVDAYQLACSDENHDLTGAAIANMYVAGDFGGAEQVSFRAIKVDDMIEGRIDFLKIDIEGHEPSAISGMDRIINQYRPTILSEMNEYWLRQNNSSANDLLKQFTSLRYKVYHVRDLKNQIQPGSLNLDILDNIEIIAIPE